jgi:hypothetical protein
MVLTKKKLNGCSTVSTFLKKKLKTILDKH